MIESRIKLVQLGSGALDFVKTKLKAGDVFTEYLLALPIDAGSACVYLPSAAEPATLDLDFGGLGRYSAEDYWGPVNDLILNFLHKNIDHAIVFENYCQRVGEGLPKQPGMIYCSYYPSRHRIWTDLSAPAIEGKAVYSLVTGISATADLVSGGFRKARRYPLVAALTVLPGSRPPDQGEEVHTRFLYELASNATHILVGAYDEEAVLIWERVSGV